MAMTAGITLLSVSLIMLASVSILGMDATHIPLLWIYSYCAALAVGLGVQAINAAFGGIGQLISMFVFIVLGLPSSGATVPLQAVPGFYRSSPTSSRCANSATASGRSSTSTPAATRASTARGP